MQGGIGEEAGAAGEGAAEAPEQVIWGRRSCFHCLDPWLLACMAQRCQEDKIKTSRGHQHGKDRKSVV